MITVNRPVIALICSLFLASSTYAADSSVNIGDDSGNSALKVAQDYQLTELLEPLKRHGAKE